VKRALQAGGVEVVMGSNIALRVHYELTGHADTQHRYVYATSQSVDFILPDMKHEAVVASDFAVGSLFPMFADKSHLASLDLDVLASLYAQYRRKRLNWNDCKRVISETEAQVEEQRRRSGNTLRSSIDALQFRWDHLEGSTMMALSQQVNDAIAFHVVDDIKPALDSINHGFQQWLDENYFASLNSANYLTRPLTVDKVLPHLTAAHTGSEKVALVVVDGMAFWQYAILHKSLEKRGIVPQVQHTMAWLPTITSLSRQAIFRGAPPLSDYTQSPANEKTLWCNYWNSKGLSDYQPQYLSDSSEFAIDERTTRLAYVTVDIDEAMHSTSHLDDLQSLTENWAERIAPRIIALREKGFTIYITTDHGNVLSHGWQSIRKQQNKYLFANNSRGKRHLIYNEATFAGSSTKFYNEHKDELPLLHHDNWIVTRNDQHFDSPGDVIITHGGCHFWEVVVPFVKISQDE